MPVVATDHGRIEGLVSERSLAFLGIPYARAPRFATPEPAEPWAGIRRGDRPGRACPQPDSALGRPREGTDEDCLVLNVWTPGLDRTDRPVLVFLHGGGFTTGSGAMPWYDGARLAARGAVVVTVNYRLGALGWLHLDGVPGGERGAGNRGLEDQLAALGWVSRHAERFGGDPERVCLFGQSAGAMSVGTLLAMPEAVGLVRRAICQSGAQAHVRSDDEAAAATGALLAELGLASPTVVALRALPVEALLAAQVRVTARSGGGLPWGPVLDGAVLDRHPADATAAGLAGGIDLLVGVNADEMRFYSAFGRRDLTEERFEARLARLLQGPAGPPAHDLVRTLADRYRGALPELPPADRWDVLQGDRVFGLPADRLVAAQLPHAPVWSYLFAYRGAGLEGRLGACHAMDLPFVFDAVDAHGVELFLGPSPDGATRRLAALVADAWVAFAATGDPRASDDLVAWAPFAGNRSVAVLDREVAVATDPLRARYELWEGVPWR